MVRKSTGRVSRHERVASDHTGAWSSASIDFANLGARLLTLSASAAKAADGNCSDYALAGIPMLFSLLRCLIIELNAGMHSMTVPDAAALRQLAESSADHEFVISRYRLDSPTADELRILWEVRCEIIHPAHRPGPETDNTPLYLRGLKARGLLQSTGRDTDYVWLDQLKSHRLFIWGCDVIHRAMQPVLAQHKLPAFAEEAIHEALGLYRRVPAI